LSRKDQTIEKPTDALVQHRSWICWLTRRWTI